MDRNKSENCKQYQASYDRIGVTVQCLSHVGRVESYLPFLVPLCVRRHRSQSVSQPVSRGGVLVASKPQNFTNQQKRRRLVVLLLTLTCLPASQPAFSHSDYKISIKRADRTAVRRVNETIDIETEDMLRSNSACLPACLMLFTRVFFRSPRY